MKTYTLKLKTTGTVDYNLYDGTTLVSDADLATLFTTAGEAYFVFDFNSLTPANTTAINILDSNNTAVIANTGLSGITENRNFKGTWGASASAFTTFALLTGVAMDEAQLSKLIGMAKGGGEGNVHTFDYTDYNPDPSNNPARLLSDYLYSKGVQSGDVVRFKCVNTQSYPFQLHANLLISNTNAYGQSENKYYNLPGQLPGADDSGYVSFTVVFTTAQYDGQLPPALYLREYLIFTGYDFNIIHIYDYSPSGNGCTANIFNAVTTTVDISGGSNGNWVALDESVGADLLAKLTPVVDIQGVGSLTPIRPSYIDQYPRLHWDIWQATKEPWAMPDEPWQGTATSETGFDYASAAVGDSVLVWVRDTDGTPMYYTNDGWTNFELTTGSGSTLTISPFYTGGSQPVKLKGTEYRRLTKQQDGTWQFQNMADAVEYAARTIERMGTLSATPTSATVGEPGLLYTYDNSGTYEVWLCVHDNGDNTYVWKQVSLI